MAEVVSADQESVVVTVIGRNAPGVCSSFVDIVANSQDKRDLAITDVAQYIIDGELVFSLIIRFGDSSPVGMMREMTELARELDMKLSFYFPTTQQAAESGDSRHVSIVVAAPDGMPVELLQSTVAYIADQGGVLAELEHRGLGGETDEQGTLPEAAPELKVFSRFRIHATVPTAMRISKIYLDLQRRCWKHGAEITVREWTAMNRPNGKSLIVFGLSDVLCPYDVLDELLAEAGIDEAAIEAATKGVATRSDTLMSKLQLLKGKPAAIQQQLAERLTFSPGAQTVCKALKELGFSLALLSFSAGSVVAQAAKQALGLDYAISPGFGVDEKGLLTGRYANDDTDMQLRKADYLTLMAEKEGIELKNVVVVGSFMGNLPKELARSIIDTYGPLIHFDVSRDKDLTIALYLLGYSSRDLRALAVQSPVARTAFAHMASPTLGPAAAPALVPADAGKRCLVRVHGQRGDTRKYGELLQTLMQHQVANAVTVLRLQQATLVSGDSFLGLSLLLHGDPTRPLKDLLYECGRVGLDISWEFAEGQASLKGKGSRFVLTVVQQPELKVPMLAAIYRQCRDLGVDCLRLDRLSDAVHFSALQITCLVPPGVEADLRSGLLTISKAMDVDIAFQGDGVERWSRRLVVFDMDSTLIQQEVIDELAKIAGVEATVSEITERAMRGELDFFQSLQERVALLKGHPAEELFAAVKQNIIFTPGAHKLCRTLKQLGYKMAVISGGFLPVAREVQRVLGLDYAFANSMETDSAGMLTGQTVGMVVTPQRKKALLSMICEVEGCELNQTVAVGDGSNDIPMLCAAGLGVAFCAKPKVQAVAEFRVNNKDLSTVLFLIGLSERAVRHLEASTPALAG